jgi:hypothetical protein
MKLTRKSDVYVLYNKESGDLYCAADSIEAAEQILKEDGERGDLVVEDMSIVDLHFWGKE